MIRDVIPKKQQTLVNPPRNPQLVDNAERLEVFQKLLSMQVAVQDPKVTQIPDE